MVLQRTNAVNNRVRVRLDPPPPPGRTSTVYTTDDVLLVLVSLSPGGMEGGKVRNNT